MVLLLFSCVDEFQVTPVESFQVEFTKSGPRVVYEGPSERSIQSREGKTGHARDGSVMVSGEHR